MQRRYIDEAFVQSVLKGVEDQLCLLYQTMDEPNCPKHMHIEVERVAEICELLLSFAHTYEGWEYGCNCGCCASEEEQETEIPKLH